MIVDRTFLTIAAAVPLGGEGPHSRGRLTSRLLSGESEECEEEERRSLLDCLCCKAHHCYLYPHTLTWSLQQRQETEAQHGAVTCPMAQSKVAKLTHIPEPSLFLPLCHLKVLRQRYHEVGGGRRVKMVRKVLGAPKAGSRPGL